MVRLTDGLDMAIVVDRDGCYTTTQINTKQISPVEGIALKFPLLGVVMPSNFLCWVLSGDHIIG